jgi:SNF2 family DNA or RNA helicase
MKFTPAPKPQTEQWHPHPYQKKAIKFLLEHAGGGLLLDPGLGKTSITLAALTILKKEGLFERALVVAPLRVCHSVWPKEIEKWENFNHFSISIIHGKKEAAVKKKADIYIINPEGLAWLFGVPKLFQKLGIDTLVIDESSKFKKTDTKRFRILKPYLPKFDRRWILTGSPAPNGLMDLFGQIYICDLGASLTPYITHYRNTYFTPSGYGGYKWKLKQGAEAAINKKVAPLCLRLDAGDYLDLPEIRYNNRLVQLPPAARKLYDTMEKEMLVELDGQSITALNAAAATNKCRQIANGGLLHSDFAARMSVLDREKWAHVHDAKTEDLLDLIEELSGQPVLVLYEFRHDLERLLKALGKDTPWIGGGVSPKRSAEICDAWNRDEVPVLLGQPQSMGHGLNLQGGACKTVVWYGMTWDFEVYDQAIKRVARQGSKHKRITVHHIIAENTVDEAVLWALRGKKKVQSGFLEALRVYAKGRR